MSDLFLKIINMSISASWLVLAVLLLRFVLKKAPKWINVLLWGIVAVRLAFPFSIESALSLIPSAETISPGIMMDTVPSVQTGVPAINSVINPVIGSSLAPAPGASANPLQIWIPILSIVWVVGVVALLLYTAVSYWRLRHKVSEAVILRDNIYQSENVASPFVLGLFGPRIYLPYNMDGQDLSHVVAHEQAHIRRRDHWWKPLGFLLLTIHWFNPLMWLAYVLLCRDIELACDEKVIKELGNEQRADYTQALVACSVNRRMIAACPLAFGEVGVKERVKSVMNYKKPAFWVIVLAVIACAVVAVCFLTNPKQDSYTLRIVVPAGSTEKIVYQEDFAYSDEEISPTGNKITISSGEGLGDTEVVLKPIEVKEENAYEPAYLTPGMPIEMDVEKGAWFKVGVNIQNPSDKDIIFYVKVEGVEVRIPDETIPNSITFEAEVLEIHEGYFLVAPEASWALNSADRIEVPMMNMDPALEPQVGDTIQIVCSGEILETYPARLSKVYSIKVALEAPTVTKWFDYLDNPSEMERGLTTELPDYPGVTFQYTVNQIIASKPFDNSELTGNVILIGGMPIWNAYFTDLTGDGYPDICATYTYGSGIIDSRIVICDYVNGASYELSDRGYHDFTLWQNDNDGQLYVNKRVYPNDELVSSGRLVFKDDCIQIEEVLSGDSEFDKYYLTIGAEGITNIEVTLPDSSGGCQNADGSPFKMGERVWLEPLDGVADLRGLEISALDATGEIVWSASIPDGDENRGFTHLTQDGWTITNLFSENGSTTVQGEQWNDGIVPIIW